MPFPAYLISANLFTCERLLLEADGVSSAIRIVDVYLIPELPPEAPEAAIPVIQARAYINLKAMPGHVKEHSIRVKWTNTLKETSTLVEKRMSFGGKPGMEHVPSTVAFVVEVNLGVKGLGICYISLEIDGEEVVRTPLTLLRTPAKAQGT